MDTEELNTPEPLLPPADVAPETAAEGAEPTTESAATAGCEAAAGPGAGKLTVADRYRGIVERFSELMPDPRTELHYASPYQLLVAVILSAQCTDKRVNMVTPAFFEAFPTPRALADATTEEVYEFIKSVSYPNSKTKSLRGMARKLVDDYGGEVPRDIDALLSLPGVGRKTANVVLAVLYGEQVMPVDTHVFRVADRIGLTTRAKNPLKTEQRLVKGLPNDTINKAHHWLILHGRYTCKARRPDCLNCPITDLCRHYSRYKGAEPKPKAKAKTPKNPKK